MTNTIPLRILIVADDPLVRAGLGVMLNEQDIVEVVGQIAATPDIAAEVSLYRPDVIVWDLGWEPVIDASTTRTVVSDDDPETVFDHLTDLRETDWPVIVLLPDDTLVSQVWATGVQAILDRGVEIETLTSALQAAMQQLIVLDPAFADGLLSTQSTPSPTLIEDLTPRESEVLQLLAEGLTNKAIARRLEVSDHTVKFHVTAIMTKLGAQSRTEAVVQATRLGLILL
ncbi:MAG: response regulator transcription factor [Chloroflexota bacterium]